MENLMSMIARFNFSFEEFNEFDEFILNDLCEEFHEFKGYYYHIEKYLKHYGFEVHQDVSYGGLYIEVHCSNIKDIKIVNTLVNRFKEVVARKYNLTYIFNLWQDSEERSKKFGNGFKRDAFLSKAFSMNKNKFFKIK